MAQITIEIADSIAAKLRADAAAGGMDEAALVETALLLFGEQAAAFHAFVAEGEADVAAGRVEDWEDVMKELEAIIIQAETARA